MSTTVSEGIRLVAGGFVFPEAPTWFEGALWVSDVMGGGIVGLDADGSVVDRRVEGRKGIGGMAVTTDGRLVCSGRDLVDTADGATLVARPDGATGFNDIGTTNGGDLVVGVLNYRPMAGDDAVPGSLARVKADGNGTISVDWTWGTGVTWPNGVGAVTDGVVLADYASGALLHFADDGASGTPGRELCRSDSGHYDGLCVDDADGVWLATGAGRSIERRTLDGELTARIELPAGFVTSVAFSGGDPNTLFVTVSDCELDGATTDDRRGAVLAVHVAVAGTVPAPAALPA